MPAVSEWHARLTEHFAQLRDQRATVGDDARVFALEHDLTETELQQLNLDCRSALRARTRLTGAWLPYVVYAAEIGYHYQGQEYWQTFEASTPGWVDYGDREFIRDSFRRFAEQFRGARPSGPWAAWFTIICWPITHAVLPTDLQIQLAHLLWDLRYSIRKDSLIDPAAFGGFLASHAWRTSPRFQNFAQNTHLLGLVGGALVSGTEAESPYLLPSTLDRIVDDLSKERDAKQWLTDARKVVARLGVKGLWRGHVRAARHLGATIPPAMRSEPKLSLRAAEGGGWAVWLQLPDLTKLAALDPEFRQALASSRSVVNGSDGAPLTRSRLLYPGQEIRLDRWPSDSPLIQLEVEQPVANKVLADECAMQTTEPWLFHIRHGGFAEEAIGRRVRPGESYIIVTRPGQSVPPILATKAATIACPNVVAYRFTVPTPPSPQFSAGLATLRLALAAGVEIRPVGVLPAYWDDDGRGEWVSGHEPQLAILADHRLLEVSVQVDNQTPITFVPQRDGIPIVGLGSLAAGLHNVAIGMRPELDSLPDTYGSALVLIREPRPQTQSGGFREVLAIIASPAQPSMDDVWSGRAAIEFRGPVASEVVLDIRLAGATGGEVAHRRITSVTLPLSSDGWQELLQSVRMLRKFERSFDLAEALTVSIRHDEYGVASLHSQRAFLPLRWSTRADHDGPYLILHRNLESASTEVTYYPFDNPARALVVSIDSVIKVRSPGGGLYVAGGSGWTARAVLPPHIRDLQALGQLYATPTVSIPPAELAAVKQLADIGRSWDLADDPGHFAAGVRRQLVLYELSLALSAALAGPDWMASERRGLTAMVAALGEPITRRGVRTELEGQIRRLGQSTGAAKIAGFRRWLDVIHKVARWPAPGDGLPAALLRFADRPWDLLSMAEQQFDSVVNVVKARPVLVRLARCFIAGAALDVSADERRKPYIR